MDDFFVGADTEPDRDGSGRPLILPADAEPWGGGPASLQRLSVQFRGMGVPEVELVVTGRGDAVTARFAED